MEERKEKTEEAAGPATGPARRRRRLKLVRALVPRESHLVALVAMARYLTTEQIRRLAFPDRHEKTAKRGVEALSGLGPNARKEALLRRVLFQEYDGTGVLAWAVTSAGHTAAEKVLGPLREPAEDIGNEFLGHTVQLNELFTRLFEPAAPLPRAKRVQGGRSASRDFARADLRRLRWVSSDGARLPWRDYDMKRGTPRERVIQPDAVLELVATRRRFFLECEMGTHTIEPVSPDKTGATLAKASRYDNYLNGFAGIAPGQAAQRQTFYEAQYGDGFKPEVLFLVLTATRAASVTEALARWRESVPRAPAIRALTFEEAGKELRDAAWGAAGPQVGPEPRGGARLDDSETKLLAGFCTDALKRLQSARHQIRLLPSAERASLKLSEPEYPKESQRVQQLIQRLTQGECPK